MKKYIPYILVFGFGIIIGMVILLRNTNNKIQKRFDEAQQIEQVKNKEIKRLQALNNGIRQRNETLNDKIYDDSIESTTDRTKIIPITKTLQQESDIIVKGQELYGASRARNSKRALVASYGNQALNEVELLRRINANQKAEVVNCESIIEVKNEIIVEYKDGLEYAAKKCKGGQFSKGFGFGVIGSILVAILVL